MNQNAGETFAISITSVSEGRGSEMNSKLANEMKRKHTLALAHNHDIIQLKLRAFSTRVAFRATIVLRK